MDIFDEEIIKFWKALQDNTVRYIMVGGLQPIYTGISDIPLIWIFKLKIHLLTELI